MISSEHILTLYRVVEDMVQKYHTINPNVTNAILEGSGFRPYFPNWVFAYDADIEQVRNVGRILHRLGVV